MASPAPATALFLPCLLYTARRLWSDSIAYLGPPRQLPCAPRACPNDKQRRGGSDSRLADLLEFCGSGLVAGVAIRVPLEGRLPVGLLQRRYGRARSDAGDGGVDRPEERSLPSSALPDTPNRSSKAEVVSSSELPRAEQGPDSQNVMSTIVSPSGPMLFATAGLASSLIFWIAGLEGGGRVKVDLQRAP